MENLRLFENVIDASANLLPYDGLVNYYGKIMSNEQANYYFDHLFKAIPWQRDEAVIFGKHMFTKRKVAWYGDEKFDYSYSNTTKHALKWTSELLELKALVKQKTSETYNSCLMNLYHSGD